MPNAAEPDDIRADIAAVVERAAAAQAEPVASTTVESPAPAKTDATPLQADGATTETPKPTEGAASTSGRDEKGRFAPKTDKTDKTEPPAKAPDAIAATAAPIGAAATTTTEPPIRAPQSLNPTEREEFAKAPRGIQQAFVRREAEYQRGIQQHAEARKLADSFNQVAQPYTALLQQIGMHPLQAFHGLLQTAYDLRTAPMQHRVKILAEHFKNFVGTDENAIKMLAAELDGTPAPAQQASPAISPQAIQQMVQRELQQAQQARTRSQLQAELDTFGPANEFFEDVKPAMIGLLQGGVASSLKDAYARACWADEGVRKIMLQREASKQAAAATAATQKAHAAAGSVKGTPAGNGSGGVAWDADIREHVAAQFGNE